MGGGAHPAPRRPPGSPGTSHTVGPVGVAPWACAYQWLLAGLSQTPAAATRAPDQSHCVFTMEQLEPEPPWVSPAGQDGSGVSQPAGIPGSPLVHTVFLLLQRRTVAGRLCPHTHAWVGTCVHGTEVRLYMYHAMMTARC